MKFLTCILITLTVFSACSNSQAPSAQDQSADARENLKNQAAKMCEAFQNNDLNTFTSYIHPMILQKGGGKEKLIEMLEKGTRDIKNSGMELVSVSTGEPSEFVEKDNELQAIVPQILIFKDKTGKIKLSSTLIAITSDKGTTWKFIDTGGKDFQALKAEIPNLSSQLKIPEMQFPEHISN